MKHKSYDYQQIKVLKLNKLEKYFEDVIHDNSAHIPSTKVGFDIWMHEHIENGLREY